MEGNLNIKVAVRIRPLENPAEKEIIEVNKEKKQLIVKASNKNEDFIFSDVLSSITTQAEVYNRCVKPIVNNILKVRTLELQACVILNKFELHVYTPI